MSGEVRVANLEQALALQADLFISGTCAVDDRGYRVDPTRIIVSPDGTRALDSGGRVYKPIPLAVPALESGSPFPARGMG